MRTGQPQGAGQPRNTRKSKNRGPAFGTLSFLRWTDPGSPQGISRRNPRISKFTGVGGGRRTRGSLSRVRILAAGHGRAGAAGACFREWQDEKKKRISGVRDFPVPTQGHPPARSARLRKRGGAGGRGRRAEALIGSARMTFGQRSTRWRCGSSTPRRYFGPPDPMAWPRPQAGPRGGAIGFRLGWRVGVWKVMVSEAPPLGSKWLRPRAWAGFDSGERRASIDMASGTRAARYGRSRRSLVAPGSFVLGAADSRGKETGVAEHKSRGKQWSSATRRENAPTCRPGKGSSWRGRFVNGPQTAPSAVRAGESKKVKICPGGELGKGLSRRPPLPRRFRRFSIGDRARADQEKEGGRWSVSGGSSMG